MSVSIRYIAAVAALTALSGAATAGGNCCTGNSGGITNVPTIPTPTTSGGGCCGTVTSHPVGVPGVFVPAPSVNVSTGGAQIGGVNVNVGGNTTIMGGSSNTYIGGGGSSGGGTYYVGGGGGSWGGPYPATPGVIEGLRVGGEQQASRVVEQQSQTRTITETMAIRAVCMDDRGMPHPASRTDGDERVADGFGGEIFRCMAGTHMEVTVGRVVNGQTGANGTAGGTGQVDWNNGRTMSCEKGQALTYRGSQLVCTAQEARASCNERSLLRRFGPGVKYVTITRTETYTSNVERSAQSSNETSFSGAMFVDGGVGQGVW